MEPALFDYHAFGMNIQSDISLKGLLPNPSASAVDVHVRKEKLSDKWGSRAGQDMFIYERNEILFQIEGVGVFSIRSGREIGYERAEGATDAYIRLYVMGSCLGLILMQREILPMHGSALYLQNMGIIITGDSGAGKSTTAAAFIKQGARLLSDDVIPVHWNETDPLIFPAYPQQKMWLNSLEQFGQTIEGLEHVVEREEKFNIPVQEHFHSSPVPMQTIVELVPADTEEITLVEVTGLAKLELLYRNTYRQFVIEPAGFSFWHFRALSAVAGRIPVYTLRRPVNRFSADEVVEAVLDRLKGEEEYDRKASDRAVYDTGGW
ncbi:aldolase [Alkalicoccus luteus]|uniref:aldolase n=1 Tax=Alkalicoccus luteus TaxID=1237094 RepID=UPI0040334B07